jgi:hypothetical protein
VNYLTTSEPTPTTSAPDQMINFDAVIRGFAPQARLLLKKSKETDARALSAIQNQTAPNRDDRDLAIRSWLREYGVFQGIVGPKRQAIASAIVTWADTRDIGRDLTTADALDIAHCELLSVCACGGGFTSLASKALWLCYPQSVPIFDRFVQRALWMISKLEKDIVTPEAKSDYWKFVHIWKALYDRYGGTLEAIDLGDYPYRVRIFDKILWLIGKPGYGLES